MKGHCFAHQVNSNTFISWSIHLSYQPFICPVIFSFGLSLPMRALKSVLLPAPEAPIIASVLLGLAFPCTFCKIFFTWPPPLFLEGTNTHRLDQEIVGWWFSVDSSPSSRVNMSESNVWTQSLYYICKCCLIPGGTFLSHTNLVHFVVKKLLSGVFWHRFVTDCVICPCSNTFRK